MTKRDILIAFFVAASVSALWFIALFDGTIAQLRRSYQKSLYISEMENTKEMLELDVAVTELKLKKIVRDKQLEKVNQVTW